MEIIYELDSDINNSDGLALTIGFFDGVHIGHQYLVNQLNEIAHKEKLKSAILTFTAHPRNILNECYKPKLLNTKEEKINLIKKLPIDFCIQIPFTTELSNFLAYDFMKEILKNKLNVKHLLIGYDHRFGKNREEGFDDYCKYGEELGIIVTKAEPYTEESFTISSSFIRNLLGVGDIKLANHYLGYKYTLQGTVIEGQHIGSKLGFPTANIGLSNKDKCVPEIGVYAVLANINGKEYKAMSYIGTRPTIEKGGISSIEVNIFDFNENIYGQNISIQFVERVRGQEKFDSQDALQTAIAHDKERVTEIFKCI